MYKLLMIILMVVSVHGSVGHVIKKRQIFREQVLPHLNGKIPDTAFNSDRLFLNRLQKEGIAIPDGVLLEQRMYQVFHHSNRAYRPVFKAALTPDMRYTPEEGKYHYHEEPSVETTYTIPQVWNANFKVAPKYPVYPNFMPLKIPNNVKVEKPFGDSNHLSYPSGGTNIPSYPSAGSNQQHYTIDETPQTSYHAGGQNQLAFNPIPYTANEWTPIFPSNPPQWIAPTSYSWNWAGHPKLTPHETDFVSQQLFGDFDTFFNSFNSRVARNSRRNPRDSDKSADKVPAKASSGNKNNVKLPRSSKSPFLIRV